MTRLLSPAFLYTLLLAAAAATLSMVGGADLKPSPARAVAAAQPQELPSLVGTWEGTWTDTRYDVSGSISMTITLDGDTYDAVGTIDVSEISPILGELTGTATGTIDGNTMDFNFECTDLGTGSGSFTDQLVTGAGVVGAPLNFGGFEFSGSVISGVMDGTFDFTDPSGGNGTASLSRTVGVEDPSWSEIKADYRG